MTRLHLRPRLKKIAVKLHPYFNRLFLLLAAVALIILGTYAARAWRGKDYDFRERFNEYHSFSQQVYPNTHLKIAGKPKATVNSVYPAYAFPMFAYFFGTGSMAVGRIMLQVTSLAALGVMIWQGSKALSRVGVQSVALSALAVIAFSGNRPAMILGQFSLISMGLVTLQAVLLERKRPALAGLCWALAMIKPQIALPFALLFILRRDWRGVAVGAAVLIALTAVTMLWTGVNLHDLVQAGPMRENLNFMKQSRYSAGIWIQTLHVAPRVATAIALIVLSILGVLLLVRDFRKVQIFPYASAVCGALGFVLFYHRCYDIIMLFPLVFATLQRGHLNRWKLADILITVALVFAVYVPESFLLKNHMNGWITFLATTAACLRLFIPQHRSPETLSLGGEHCR